jgi:RimJ/RimL family protein N-acetyltransferase
MTPTLETQRLWLYPLQLSDADQIQEVFPHWEVVRFLAGRVPWPYPADGARTYCRDIALPAAQRGEEWHWTLRCQNNATQVIGCISLKKLRNRNRGFWIGLTWQGQGLMSEACEVVTDYWFDVLKFPVLRVVKAIDNTASRRISASQGMRVVAIEEREFVSGRFPAEIWEITAEEWHRRRNPR